MMKAIIATRPAPWVATGRVPSLDGLRAAAILLVVCCHARPAAAHGLGAVFVRLAAEGKIGVDIFFVISGFLITLLLLRESDRTGSISLRGFFARRALRLLPALVAYLVFVAALARVGAVRISALDWLGAATYTINMTPIVGHRPAWLLGHLWSLSVEEHFYLIWPVALAALGARRARAALMIVLAASPTIRVLLSEAFSPDVAFGLLRISTPARLDAIGAGCLLGFFMHDPGSFHRRPRGRAEVVSRGAAVVLVVSCLFYSATGFFEVAARDTLKSAAIVGLVAHVTLRPKSWLGRLLNARPMVWLGTLSYSLYLWQQPFLNGAGWLAISRWPYNLPLALACAVASRALVERPFLRLKDRGVRHIPVQLPRPHLFERTAAEHARV